MTVDITCEMRKRRVFIVDDEEDILSILEKRFSDKGFIVFKSQNCRRLIEKVRQYAPDIIILDIMMPDCSGLEVKNELNQNKDTANIPVIFLTARDKTDDKIKGFNLGADDYITKPFDSKELMARVESILKRRRYYEEISMTDGLTGLYNYAFFQKQFGVFFKIARRYKRSFVLAVVDVDKLKLTNDTYGHAGGDFVLRKFALIARETLRGADLVLRYGGDEFAIIMPEISGDQAKAAINRLKSRITGKIFPFKDISKELTFTISVGMAAYDDSIENESEMFRLADKDLYDNKNRIEK